MCISCTSGSYHKVHHPAPFSQNSCQPLIGFDRLPPTELQGIHVSCTCIQTLEPHATGLKAQCSLRHNGWEQGMWKSGDLPLLCFRIVITFCPVCTHFIAAELRYEQQFTNKTVKSMASNAGLMVLMRTPFCLLSHFVLYILYI